MIKKIIIITSLLIITAYPSEPIAVNELNHSGISRNEAIALSDALRTEIGKTDKYEVMERAQMESVLIEQGFQQSGACDASCAIEIGQLLAVKYIVLGNIGKVGKTYTLNIRLVDVRTGKIIKDITENYKGSLDNLLTKTVPLAAKKLTGTYKSNKGLLIGSISAVIVAGVAIPAAILFLKDDEPEISTTGVKIIWGE